MAGCFFVYWDVTLLFSKDFESEFKKRAIENYLVKVRRNRELVMSDSEIKLIMILFYTCRFRYLKFFYTILLRRSTTSSRTHVI